MKISLVSSEVVELRRAIRRKFQVLSWLGIIGGMELQSKSHWFGKESLNEKEPCGKNFKS